jgi:hypothetical protein
MSLGQMVALLVIIIILTNIFIVVVIDIFIELCVLAPVIFLFVKCPHQRLQSTTKVMYISFFILSI